MVGPAFAASDTQTITGTLGSTIGATTAGDGHITLTAGQAVPDTDTDDTVTVDSNVAYNLSVVADKAKMTEWVGEAYVTTSAKALTSALQAMADTANATLKDVPTGATPLPLNATPQAADGGKVFHMTLSQPVAWTDPPADYHIVLTYTAAAPV